MSLKTQPPKRVPQTILDGGLGVRRGVGTIHRLQEKVPEIEALEFFRWRFLLRVDELQLAP
jgi:hypothetical protein